MTGPFVEEGSAEHNAVQVPCPCVGTPHDHDEVYIRTELSGYESAKIQGAMFTISAEGKPMADVAATNLVSMETCVVGWSFVDARGMPIPFDASRVNRLRSDIWKIVLEEVDKLTEDTKPPLENESSAGGTSDTSPPERSTFASAPLASSPSSLTVSRALASKEPTSS